MELRLIGVVVGSDWLRKQTRRQWLALAGAGIGGILLPGCRKAPEAPAELPFDAPLRFPGKVPMRVLNDRPPCLETPWEYFRHHLTPNDAFYVRWHLQMIPTEVDLRTWRLTVGGHVDHPVQLSMAELRRMEPASIVAVNQCSGNSRSLFEPRLPGAQWGNGAMGNARWTGVRLADLLRRAGIKAGAVEVSFAGLDRAGLASVPNFVKSLTIDFARRPDILVAYEMNGEPLPLLNGFPARLVVPGWFATYWIKALSEITVLDRAFEGFWMKEAYRIPRGNDGLERPDQLAAQTVPINVMRIRSFITSPDRGQRIPVGGPIPVDGIAFDGADGVQRVDFSANGGRSWQNTTLGEDLGRYSFRRWRVQWQPQERGEYRLQCRATSTSGATQPATAGWNRAGYLRNVIEEIRVQVV
jgi:DMSO/TMAO reductase YedYZ molybdopterin-dependent catalytic subunit